MTVMRCMCVCVCVCLSNVCFYVGVCTCAYICTEAVRGQWVLSLFAFHLIFGTGSFMVSEALTLV